jgi:hypothetical protein
LNRCGGRDRRRLSLRSPRNVATPQSCDARPDAEKSNAGGSCESTGVGLPSCLRRREYVA